MPSVVARGWLVTINNPFAEEWDVTQPDAREVAQRYFDRYAAAKDLRYMVGQLERGQSGTLHWQLYVEFSKAVRASHVRAHIPGHVERRNGTREQARDYVTKEESRVLGIFEEGNFNSDVQEARALGVTCSELRIVRLLTALQQQRAISLRPSSDTVGVLQTLCAPRSRRHPSPPLSPRNGSSTYFRY